MKKLVAFLTFTCGVGTFIHIQAAEAAAAAAPAPMQEGIHALFMLGHRNRPPLTFFDTYRFGPTDLAYTQRMAFNKIESNQLDAIQYGHDYYIFVPSAAHNRVLVFTAQEDGQFQHAANITTGDAPVDVSVVEHQGKLYLFVANATNSVEVFSFDGTRSWQQTSTLQVLDKSVPLTRRDYTISPFVIKAVRFNKKVYLFMINDRVDHLMMSTLDDDGQLQSMAEVDALQLPIRPDTDQKISYSLEAVPYDDALYLFMGGEAGDVRNGFTRIGRMDADRAFQDITPQSTRENKLIPNSMAVVKRSDSVEVYIGFYDVTQIEVYSLSSAGLSHRSRVLKWFPLQMRTFEHNAREYLVVLNFPRRGSRYSIDVYAIQPDGTLSLIQTDLELQVPRLQIPPYYQNFTIIPYYGQTQREIKEAIDITTKQKIPTDVLKRISEFVTPVP